MTIPFEKYCKIKNKYCLAYYGKDEKALLRLIEIRSQIAPKYPTLQLFITCNDALYQLIENKTDIVSQSYLRKDDFGHIREFQNIDATMMVNW